MAGREFARGVDQVRFVGGVGLLGLEVLLDPAAAGEKGRGRGPMRGGRLLAKYKN